MFRQGDTRGIPLLDSAYCTLCPGHLDPLGERGQAGEVQGVREIIFL